MAYIVGLLYFILGKCWWSSWICYWFSERNQKSTGSYHRYICYNNI